MIRTFDLPEIILVRKSDDASLLSGELQSVNGRTVDT